MKKPVITIEIGVNNIKIVQIEPGSGIMKLISIEEEFFNNQEEFKTKLIKLLSKYKLAKTRFITILPRYQVFLKRITLPPGTAQEIKGMLPFESEKYLPFSSDTAVIDCYPIKPISEDEPNEVYLVAVKRETIDKHLELFNSIGLVPNVVSVTTFALNNFITNLQLDPVAVISFSSNSWEIAIFSQNRLVISRGFNLSTNYDSADSLVTVKTEIENSVTMFYSAGVTTKLDKIYYLTSTENVGFIEKLSNVLNIKLELFDNSINNLVISDKNVAGLLNKYMIPIQIGVSDQKINLLPIEAQKKIIKKHQNKMWLTGIVALLIVVLVICTIILGLYYHKNAANRLIGKELELNKKEIVTLARINNQLEVIENYKVNNILPLEIINEISQNLPDNVYISQFDYDYVQNDLTIHGKAVSYAIASKAIAKFGKSKYISQVTNKGAYSVKVGDKDLVDFEIVCILNKRSIK